MQLDTRLMALLVHRGLLSAPHAKAALDSGQPDRWLLDQGVVDEDTLRDWIETEGGSRPRLTRYELGDALGTGGQATVFRATDRTDNSIVALKVLRPELCKDRVAVERFVAESKMLLDLDCDQIVRGRRVAKEGDVFFCAMELIDGECLQDTVAREGRLDEELALRVVRQVADALSFLHGRGLVHRDVKPGNIMLEAETGRAVLIDLGFAVGGDAAGSAETTAGTVAYISPEQARGSGALDVRADIYSLGATLYHLVTGSLPFEGDSGEEVMAKQVLESLSGQRIRDMGLSQHTHFFIEKMMAKEADIRFQDPAELAAEIQVWLDQIERERAESERARPRRRRNRKWL